MAEVQLDTTTIKLALQHDARFIIQFFLQDEIADSAIPAFHEDIFYDMTSAQSDRLAVAIPRDHAKTTLAKIAAIWYLLFTPYRFILYVSNTVGIAIPAVNDIINFIESDNFKAVFGPVIWYMKQDGKGIYKFELNGKICMLRAHGAGMQVRGINIDNKRPQLAIVDDLEDNDNLATPELFTKLKRWWYGPFLKALDKFDNKIIHLGNMISQQSLLFEHCESEFWSSMRYGAITEDGTPLWPEAWPIDKLKRDFAIYQKAGMLDVWFAEMMNMPVTANGGIIKASEIGYAPLVYPEDCEYTFITVDLAISKEEHAHETVTCVHAFVNDKFQIVQTDAFVGIDPIALFWHLIRTAFSWRVSCIGIESVAFQASLQYIYPHICRQEQIEGLIFVPLLAKGHKTERIITWAGLIKAGEYVLNEGEISITEQLLNYDPQKPKKNKDDRIDCAAYGPQMLENYMAEILTSRTFESIGEHQTEYSFSSV